MGDGAAWWNLVGYGGMVVIVGGYFLNQAGRLRSDDWRFPAANLLGSLGMLVSLWFEPNPPSVVIELFWCSISVYGIVRALRR